jgi:hypothetical protein
MENIGYDIFVFRKSIPFQTIELCNTIRNESNSDGRIDANDILMESFNSFIKELYNDVILDYLKIYDVENGIGYNSSIDTVNEIKEYVSPLWREVFLLKYSETYPISYEKNVHWDFSMFTIVGCLNDEFEGGELEFPRQEISVLLKKGDIVIFPGGLTHPHFVNKVTKGERYVIVGQTLYPGLNKIK